MLFLSIKWQCWATGCERNDNGAGVGQGKGLDGQGKGLDAIPHHHVATFKRER